MPLKPVVFVPGFPASELVRRSTQRTICPPALGDLLSKKKKELLVRLLCGPDSPAGDIVAGEPIRDVLGIAKQAQSLYDRLQEYGYTVGSGDNFRAVGWDWRQAVDDAGVQGSVAAAITSLAQQNQAPVVVIAHSTGGLVLRSLLEARPALAASIGQVLGFGVPWAGTLKAVRYLARGEKFGIGPASLGARDVRTVMRHAQAAYDLFPPDPARTRLTTADGAPLDLFIDTRAGAPVQCGPLVELGWSGAPPDPRAAIGAASADQRLGARSSALQLTPPLPITNVVGWGGTTDTRCELGAGGKLAFRADKEGDTTVALVSAAWLRGPGVRTFFLPIGAYPTNGVPRFHSRIWDAPPVYELLDQVLKDTAAEPFVCGAADSDEAIDRQGNQVTLRLAAADATGRALPNARVRLRGVAPETSVKFQGKARLDLALSRTGLAPNVAGTDFLRFEAEISWNGGRREVPMLIRA